MTTSLKKLLLVSITLLLGVMSDGVMATAPTTNYDFTFSNDGSNDPGNVSGVFTVTSGYITGISGSTTGISGGDVTLNSIYSATGIHNKFDYPTTPYLGGKLYFTTSVGNYVMEYFSGSTYVLQGGGTAKGCLLSCTGTLTVSLSTGAPEIDGSLAPKVGFLLGCLFLMFGRKKQHTGSTLA